MASPTITRMTLAPARSRRGIAMMLVLVALLITTILVGAVLTSRDNAPAIGQNAIASTEAAWTAESGANFAVGAVVQAPDLDALMGGDASLTQTMSVDGVDVRVSITNLLGLPPSTGDRELIVTATADIGGIEKTVVKRLTVIQPVDVDKAIDPYLREFAVFANGSAQIQDGAVIRPWPLDAESAAGLAKIGFGFADLAMLDLGATVGLSKAGLYTDIDAGLPLEASVAGRGAAATWAIPLDVPALPAGAPNGFNALADLGADLDLDAFNSAITIPGHFGQIRVRNSGVLLIDEDYGPMYSCDRLRVESGAVIRIQGNVHLKVVERVELDAGAIILDPGASLTMYVGDEMNIENRSRVGIDPADLGGPGLTTYVAPERCRIFAISPGAGGAPYPAWRIDTQSHVVASMHCPQGAVVIDGASTLYGRLAVQDLSLRTGCQVLSCPTLDSRMGLTEPDGPLYNDDGTPIDGLADVLAGVVTSIPSTADDFANILEDLWGEFVDLSGGGATQSGAHTETQTILNILLPAL